jgi:acetyl esterase/lipase
MEFDPLRDEGILYALKMMQAGIRTELHSFPGTFHGSAAFDDAQISRREKTEMFAVLKRGLQIED